MRDAIAVWMTLVLVSLVAACARKPAAEQETPTEMVAQKGDVVMMVPLTTS
jgi:hypothetical protein